MLGAGWPAHQRMLAHTICTRSRVQVTRLTAESEARLAAAEEAQKHALHRQLVELTGTADEIAALREEKDKEGRVELLRRQVTRRIMNSGISRGWTAWVELWEAKTYAMSRLREVGNKLRAPEVSSVFGEWKEDCTAAKRAEERAQLERERNSIEAQLRRVRHEVGQLEMVRSAHEDEIQALKAKVQTMSEDALANQAELAAATTLRLEHEAFLEQLRKAQEAAQLAERLKSEAEEDVVKQRRENQRMLERLLAEQRNSFQDEREQLMQVCCTPHTSIGTPPVLPRSLPLPNVARLRLCVSVDVRQHADCMLMCRPTDMELTTGKVSRKSTTRSAAGRVRIWRS